MKLRWAPKTQYTLRHNAASILKDLIAFLKIYISLSYFASGSKGDKGERGQADDTRTEIQRLEANLVQLQDNMTKQMGK